MLLMPLLYPVTERDFGIFSVKHGYESKWNDNTRLTTCDPHAKRTVTSSESPQEVKDKMEIIFTYDVDFQVIFHS